MGKRLGLVIGMNTSPDPAFRPLQFAETDARALAQWLVNTRGGGWNPADIQLLLGSQATRELAESLISQLCINIAGPEDLALIYFAGHAYLDETTGEGYLTLANTRYSQPTTGLHLSSMIFQAVARSRGAQVVVLLDCFQTGPLWSMRRVSSYDFRPLLNQNLLMALQQAGAIFFCSCRGNELAPEAGEKNLGLLMYRMILGLCGSAADPATGQITLQSLCAFLSTTLDAQHRPQIFGQERSPFVLVDERPSSSTSGQLSPITSSANSGQFTSKISPTTSGQLSLSLEEQQNQQRSLQLLNSARQSVLMQKIPEAFNLVSQTLELAPTNIDALILQGQLLGASGHFAEAMIVVERILQLDANNALVWSMRAALLTNLGRYQEALPAVERSLALDPGNSETFAIKTSILNNLEWLQHNAHRQEVNTPEEKRGGPISFFIGAFISLFALFIGAIGAALPIVQPQLPIIVAFLLESLGLSLLCINAARGAYLYGLTRLVLTFFTSLLPVAMLGALYKFGYSWLEKKVIASPPLIVPILFLGLWLVVAATVPLLLAIGGFFAGLVKGVHRN